MRLIPTSMNHSSSVELHPQRQCPKPLDDLAIVRRPLEYFQEGLVLLPVLLKMHTKVRIVIIRVQRVVRNRVC